MSLRAVGAGVAALVGLCFTAVLPSVASAGMPSAEAGLGTGIDTGTGGAKVPKLAVSIDNSTDLLTAGREVVYTINVRNESDQDLSNVVVSQLLPTALTQLEAEPKPTDSEANQVQWLAKVPARDSVLIMMTGKVGSLSLVHKAGGKARLTTTACVAADLKSPVSACASEADVVTAGVADADDSDRIILPVALLGAVCCGGGGYLWYRRKRAQEEPQ
ncbi:hypothetical protein GCM10027569_24480 [Flindersiella endophytica]